MLIKLEAVLDIDPSVRTPQGRTPQGALQYIMKRSLAEKELALEDPDMDDETITWYVPCWFNVDDAFEGVHVETDENDDTVELYASYNVKTGEVSLELSYWMTGKAGEKNYSAPVAMDMETRENLERAVAKAIAEDKDLAREIKELEMTTEDGN